MMFLWQQEERQLPAIAVSLISLDQTILPQLSNWTYTGNASQLVQSSIHKRALLVPLLQISQYTNK